MVDTALHSPSPALSFNKTKTNAAKKKKEQKKSKKCLPSSRTAVAASLSRRFWRSRWLYACLPACLQCRSSAAALPLTLSHTHFALSLLQLALPLCACVCVCMCVCYAHLIFNLLYPNFIWRPISQSPSSSLSLLLLSLRFAVQIQVQGAAEADDSCCLTLSMQLAFACTVDKNLLDSDDLLETE